MSSHFNFVTEKSPSKRKGAILKLLLKLLPIAADYYRFLLPFAADFLPADFLLDKEETFEYAMSY